MPSWRSPTSRHCQWCLQALAIAVWLEGQTILAASLPLVSEPGWAFRLTMVLTLTATTACLIWLSEQITQRGIGWGASLVFFAALVVGLPGAVTALLDQLPAGQGALPLAGLVGRFV